MTAPVAAEPQSTTSPAGNSIEQAIANQRVAVETGTSAARLAPEGAPPPGVEIPVDPTVAPLVDPNAPVEAVPEAVPETPEGEPVPEPIVVALPGRRPGDADMEIEVSDPAVAERINNALKSYERKKDSVQRYQAAEQLTREAEEFQTMIATNPAQVVQNTLDPERQKYLGLQLVVQHWDEMQDTLIAMLNDQSGNTQALVRAKLEAESLRLQQEAQQQIQTGRQVARNTQQVVRALETIAPPSLTGPQREAWITDARNDLAQYVSQHNLQQLDPLHLPMLLQHRLRAWNTDPQQAAQHLYATLTGSRQGAPAAQTSSGSPPLPPTGPKLVRAAASLKAAAAAAPSGAVSPPAAVPRMPDSIKTVTGAIDYRRQQLGLPSQ